MKATMRARMSCALRHERSKAQPTRELEEVAAAIAFGSVALELSRHDEAKAAYLESLLLARQLGVEAEVYVALLGLAALAPDRVTLAKARARRRVERILDATGFTPELWNTTYTSGRWPRCGQASATRKSRRRWPAAAHSISTNRVSGKTRRANRGLKAAAGRASAGH